MQRTKEEGMKDVGERIGTGGRVANGVGCECVVEAHTTAEQCDLGRGCYPSSRRWTKE